MRWLRSASQQLTAMRRIQLDIILLTVYLVTEAAELHDKHLQHYEALEYDTDELHLRHRRSTGGRSLQFTIEAFGRSLPLTLRRDASVFGSGLAQTDRSVEREPEFVDFLYSGQVTGSPGSSVNGAVIGGVFRGTIRVQGETTYHVESSHRAFKDSPTFHSIIYRDEDYICISVSNSLDPEETPIIGVSFGSKLFTYVITISPPAAKDRDKMDPSGDEDISPSCGISDRIISRAAHSSPPSRNPDSTPSSSLRNTLQHEREPAHQVYTVGGGLRQERSVRGRQPRTNNDFSQKMCSMELTSDPIMWKYMTDKYKNRDLAKYEILYIFASHVQALNDIFGSTVFTTDSSGGEDTYSGIKFNIEKTNIMTEDDCSGDIPDILCQENLDSQSLLDSYIAHNQEGGFEYPDYEYEYGTEYSDYSNDTYIPLEAIYTQFNSSVCLTYLITARELDKSRLGLAYPAMPGYPQGICDTFGANAGIVTLLYSNTELLPTITKLVFSHEVGHSFGAEHDDEGSDCPKLTVDEEEGYYLMYSKAQLGNAPNNHLFSNCSKKSIGKILSIPERTICFTDTFAAFCGNNIVEEGEECDCGFLRHCKDPCCVPRGGNPKNPEQECRLRPGSICSPSQGPCCNASCSYVTKGENLLCKKKTSCSEESYCHGEKHGADCPPPVLEEDGAYCSTNGRICRNGECIGSVCSLIEWTECQVTNSKTKLTIDEKEDLCYMACRRNRSSVCVSSQSYNQEMYPELHTLFTEFVQKQNMTSLDIRLPIGYPCNGMQGYCDVFHRCRGVEPDTPLARLKRLLFSKEFRSGVVTFLQEKWWAVLLAFLALVVLMIVMIIFCAFHTPSDNPTLEPFKESIRRLSFRKSSRRRHEQIEIANRDEDVPIHLEKPGEDVPLNIEKPDDDVPLNIEKPDDDVPLNTVETST